MVDRLTDIPLEPAKQGRLDKRLPETVSHWNTASDRLNLGERGELFVFTTLNC